MNIPKSLPHGASISAKTKMSTWSSVCASCDRIHSPEGWRKPASGELDHSQITHDICPDCIRDLYPSYAHIADQLSARTPKPNQRRYS